MAAKKDIRRIIGKIQREPGLIDDLLNAGSDSKRKQVLVGKGHMKQADKFNRAEVQKEIQALLTSDNPDAAAAGARVVEWVGAVAVAAAGAAAGACTGD